MIKKKEKLVSRRDRDDPSTMAHQFHPVLSLLLCVQMQSHCSPYARPLLFRTDNFSHETPLSIGLSVAVKVRASPDLLRNYLGSVMDGAICVQSTKERASDLLRIGGVDVGGDDGPSHQDQQPHHDGTLLHVGRKGARSTTTIAPTTRRYSLDYKRARELFVTSPVASSSSSVWPFLRCRGQSINQRQ